MFGSKNAKATTVVAREANFEGCLELAGSAHVEGGFKGTLRAGGELSVGPDGAVEGALTAETMVIAGRVRGTVVATKHLHILSSGRVDGRIYYQALQVDRGGAVSGEVHQGDPTALDAAPETPQDEEQSGLSPAAPRLVTEEHAHVPYDIANGQ